MWSNRTNGRLRHASHSVSPATTAAISIVIVIAVPTSAATTATSVDDDVLISRLQRRLDIWWSRTITLIRTEWFICERDEPSTATTAKPDPPDHCFCGYGTGLTMTRLVGLAGPVPSVSYDVFTYLVSQHWLVSSSLSVVGHLLQIRTWWCKKQTLLCL